MRLTKWRLAASLAVLALALPGAAAAQTSYPNVKLAGRLQVEYYDFNTTDNALGALIPLPENSFLIRRARIEAKGNLTENITFVIQPNFTSGSLGGAFSMKDAYLDVAFTKPEARNALVLRAGQFKRYFGRYELTSSNNLPSIERGAYRGLVPVSSNDLAVGNGFEAHDVGAGLMYAGLGSRLAVSGAVMNGALNTNNLDINNAKSLYGRATFAITKMLAVGASYANHDFIRAAIYDTISPGVVDTIPLDSAATNSAFGLDAQWSAPGNEGLYVMADYLNGESILDNRNSIWGIQVVAAYNIRMKSPSSFLYAIEPAFRYDLAEPNNHIINDQTTLITGGVNFYLSSKAQFRLMYESQSFEDPSLKTISGVRTALTMNF
ncbi:MAG TPA: porin [Gemmatimonadales bacterium]|nr:porin [Gemmatimonadales bacterium]